MHRVSTVFEPYRNRVTRTAGRIAAGALVATLALTPVAYAQDATPDASPVVVAENQQTSAEITSLFSTTLTEFPTAPVSVRLLRMTLQPGASSPMHTHPGPELDFVVSGALTVNSQGDATVVGADGAEATRSLSGDVLTAGDLVVFPPGTGMNLINDSDGELVLYSAVFHPIDEEGLSTTYTEGEPEAGAFAGLTYQVLGDGQIQTFPTGETTISLDEVTAPAGTDLPAQNGATLYSQVAGAFAFAVTDGSVQVSRTASPGLRPNAAPEQEFNLATGDSAFFPNGVNSAARGDQPNDLSLLRLSAAPATPLESQPATIAFIESEAEVEQPTESFAEIAIGATVATNVDNLNIREEATVNSDVVEQLADGVQLTIIGGPEEADEFVWWQIQSTDEDNPVEGWVVEEFINLAGGESAPEATEEPAEETPESEVTPAASTPAASSEPDAGFQVGDIAITTDENVRMRSEASINSEPIDAFPAGSEFEVTGNPVTADDFTWYPVTLVADDSVSGWMVIDFLEPAPDDEE